MSFTACGKLTFTFTFSAHRKPNYGSQTDECAEAPDQDRLRPSSNKVFACENDDAYKEDGSNQIEIEEAVQDRRTQNRPERRPERRPETSLEANAW